MYNCYTLRWWWCVMHMYHRGYHRGNVMMMGMHHWVRVERVCAGMVSHVSSMACCICSCTSNIGFSLER